MSSFDGGGSLLFDTFVPISSIITITIVVGYTLPRNECFGLFWLLSWTIAVIISLKGSPSSSDDTSNNNSNNNNNNNNKHVTREEEEGGNGLFNTGNDTNDQIWGIIILVGIPLSMLLILFVWWKKQEVSLSSSSRRRKQQRQYRFWFCHDINPIRNFVLKYVPLWSMVAIHIYRLDGLSIVIPFWKHESVPIFIGYQTIVLDILMGITAIPFAYVLYRGKRKTYEKKKSTISGGGTTGSASIFIKQSWIKDLFWLWNSIGLYDLCSAYMVLILNIFGIGGPNITEPPLLQQLGRHPFPLLILFQVPLAISIHILLLTNMHEIIEEQQVSSSLMVDNQLALPR
mmetsp:Transcript_28357/g.28715  ORF Transcript_28357/g.28715 Transcript_28357/m.28715 type:complete len:343 (-) Transcript_28357:1394-2422(-)